MAVSNLVSVCIPTLNRANYLQLCLESVAAQSYQEIEIIVCDNASSDQTPAIISAFKVANPKIPLVYFQQRSLLSMVDNWNAALRLARGEYAILLSDDDLLRAQAIAKLVQEASKPDTAFAYCDVDLIDSQGNKFGNNRKNPALESVRNFARNTLLERRELFPASLLFRMEFAHGIGLFPPIGNPADVAFRLLLATECGASYVRCVQQALVCYRVHNSGLTAKPELTKTGELELCGWLQSKYKNDNWITQRVTFRLLVLLYQGDTNSNIPRREWARKQLEATLQENQTLSRWFRLRLRFALSKHCKRRLSKRVFPWLSFEYTRSVRLRQKLGYLTKASRVIPHSAA